MDYDIEREKHKSAEIRKVFRDMFPLVSENDLPWAACQIQDFLKGRIEFEIKEGTNDFVYRISQVLCEVTRPKTWLVDMARIVVEEVKQARRDKAKLEELADLKKERDEMLSRFEEIGKVVGCNHVNDPDGRLKLVRCVQESLAAGAV